MSESERRILQVRLEADVTYACCFFVVGHANDTTQRCPPFACLGCLINEDRTNEAKSTGLSRTVQFSAPKATDEIVRMPFCSVQF